jgi:hypothetical protein
MTTFGKILAFVNLVVGIALLTWGVSVYANRADWVDRKTGTDSVEGEIGKLKKEIDRLTRSVADADAAYGQRLKTLAQTEAWQHYSKVKLDGRIAQARQGVFKVQKRAPNNPAFVDVNDDTGGPVPGPDGKPLRGVDALVKDFTNQVRQAQLHRLGDRPVQPNEWANPQALLAPDRFPTLGITDLRTLHGLLSDQVAAVDVAADKQREVLAGLRTEAEYLIDQRVEWSTRLQTLESRQRQLEGRLGKLGR